MSLRKFATFRARTSLAVIALFTLSFFPPARTAELTLQVLPLRPNQPPQFRLNGEGSTYVVQTSTNLTSWTIFRSLTTTNGTADFSYENNPQGVLFLRAVQEALPEISVELKVAEDFIFTTLLTAEGGSVEFPTPDLRTMILFFPTNSVIRPTEITISVVTNFAGSPFAQGGFGGVKLEPENLSLGAAATLTIPFPAGTDGRRVLSFATQNDGTLFSLFPDRALSNEVVIPFTRLATYGSSVATTSEAEVLLGPIEPGPADSSGILSASSLGLLQRVDPACVYLRRNQSFGDASQFNQTSRDCYDVLVDRALAVQRELRLFLTCGIQADIAQAIGIQRQRELLVGEEAGSLDYSSVTNEICKLYNETIEPLWKEATNNCPLAGVLLQFMLGFEQQMQTLGITNVPCNYTVFGNLDKVCASAAECLSEIKTCCALGHRGQQKYLEIVDILK
ncbi:MAG: hypothetical protein ACXW32_17555, partial [Limisphaerales bacterium]